MFLVVNAASLSYSDGLKGKVALSPAKHLDLQTTGDSVQDELSVAVLLPRHGISLVPRHHRRQMRVLLS